MKKSWLIGIFSLVFAVSYAQQDSVKLSLSLEEAKQYALEKGFEIDEIVDVKLITE